MPGWHKATQELQQEGKVQMVGIIQEQHPDRCRLFMQWQEMDWPILVDSLNLHQVNLVPITLAIDEHGVVRHARLGVAAAKTIEETFLSQTYAPPAGHSTGLPVTTPALEELRTQADKGGAGEWRAYADALALWRGLDDVVEAYSRAVTLDPADGWSHFRLGVTHRLRYDSEGARPDDFQRAVSHWSEALNLDPNNYIWRRRIQQYGPRLKKPYPFYDWVSRARDEIAARGEVPVELRVEPSRSEFARPARSFAEGSPVAEEPDPSGRIHRDPGRFIGIEAAAVPGDLAPGDVARIHLLFRPNASIKAHWNNEVDDLLVWVNAPPGWKADTRSLTVPSPPQPVSNELRSVEFEVRAPEDAPLGSMRLPAYALYYVCEDVDGTCLYRRQDLEVQLAVVDSTP